MDGFVTLIYTYSESSVGLPRRGFYLNFSSIKCPGLPDCPSTFSLTFAGRYQHRRWSIFIFITVVMTHCLSSQTKIFGFDELHNNYNQKLRMLHRQENLSKSFCVAVSAGN